MVRALSPCGAQAAAEDAAPPAGTPALLQMTLNRVDKGAVRVLLRGTDVLIAAAALRDAGLVSIPAAPEDIGGELYVRAAALGGARTRVEPLPASGQLLRSRGVGTGTARR